MSHQKEGQPKTKKLKKGLKITGESRTRIHFNTKYCWPGHRLRIFINEDSAKKKKCLLINYLITLSLQFFSHRFNKCSLIFFHLFQHCFSVCRYRKIFFSP